MGCILLCLDVLGCLTGSSLGVQRMAGSIEEASMIFLDRAASKMMALMESFFHVSMKSGQWHADHDIKSIQILESIEILQRPIKIHFKKTVEILEKPFELHRNL